MNFIGMPHFFDYHLRGYRRFPGDAITACALSFSRPFGHGYRIVTFRRVRGAHFAAIQAAAEAPMPRKGSSFLLPLRQHQLCRH